VTRAGLVLAAGLCLGAAAPAAAQPAAAPRPRSFELSAGGIAIGPVNFGAATASLTANQSAAPETTLFKADSELGTAAGLDGRLAFHISRALAIEGGFVWTRATLDSRITSDVEGIPDVTLSQQLDTYFIEASVLWHLNGLAFAGGRMVPFLAGGAGYLRQLDDTQLLTSDPGEVYHAGGGVKYVFLTRPRGFIRRLGVRADGRAYIQRGGVELDAGRQRRTRWGVSAGATVGF
jgi:hypothetical protein